MRMLSAIVIAILSALPARAGDVLDRVVVTVNGNAVLQSDWDAEVRYEALMAGRPLSDMDSKARDAALTRVIDQELVREQSHGVEIKPVTASELDRQMDALRSQYEHDHPGLSWNTTVAKYGFSDAELRERVEMELTQLRIVDEKLRPTVEIDLAEVESYYKEKIAPQNSPGHTATFDEVKDKIRELLMQQKINQALDSWLESLRAQANIHRIASEAAGTAAQ